MAWIGGSGPLSNIQSPNVQNLSQLDREGYSFEGLLDEAVASAVQESLRLPLDAAAAGE